MQSAGNWRVGDKCDFQKTHCTIGVLDPIGAQELCLQELPRQVFPKKKMMYVGLYVCIYGSNGTGKTTTEYHNAHLFIW